MDNKRRTRDRYMTPGMGLTLSLLLCLSAIVSTLWAHTAQDPNATLPRSKKTASAKKPLPTRKTAPARKPTLKSAKPNAGADEIAFWESIKNSTNPEDFKAYLKKY